MPPASMDSAGVPPAGAEASIGKGANQQFWGVLGRTICRGLCGSSGVCRRNVSKKSYLSKILVLPCAVQAIVVVESQA
eukprot:135873-Rhodomonas_salina.1